MGTGVISSINRVTPAPTVTLRVVSRSTANVAPSPRIPALDGLRGIAILLVLLRHSVAGTETTSRIWLPLVDSLHLTWSGVDLFFVLSGFLIGGILLDARDSQNYFRTFYLRRFFRIFPAYYLFLAIYFARHLPIKLVPGALGEASPLPIPCLSFLTFTHNFWMAQFGWFGPWAIAPTWSLAIEEQFYLTVPLLIRKIKTSSLYIVLACIILGAPILRWMLPHVLKHGAFADYVLTPCRADALSSGILAALLYRSTRFKSWLRERSWALHTVTAMTGAAIVYLNYWRWDQYKPLMSTWGLSCLAAFYACVLLSVVCGHNRILESFLRFTPLRKLGVIAYGTYLSHAMLMQAARALLRAHTSLSAAAIWPTGGAVGGLLAVAVATMSWKLLEKPLLSYAQKFKY